MLTILGQIFLERALFKDQSDNPKISVPIPQRPNYEALIYSCILKFYEKLFSFNLNIFLEQKTR
jgi:hypothetical protein